jgi:hypothetical protein
MHGEEHLNLDPFSLCMLKRSLDALFSMVDVRKLHGKVLWRRSRKHVFGIFEMKYANFYVPKRIVIVCISFFVFLVQIDVVEFLLI